MNYIKMIAGMSYRTIVAVTQEIYIQKIVTLLREYKIFQLNVTNWYSCHSCIYLYHGLSKYSNLIGWKVCNKTV